jgi:hypothetical protein
MLRISGAMQVQEKELTKADAHGGDATGQPLGR